MATSFPRLPQTGKKAAPQTGPLFSRKTLEPWQAAKPARFFAWLASYLFQRHYRSMKKVLVALCLWLMMPGICLAWPGTVLSVHDGDTLTVAPGGDAGTPVVVRLYGVDAPEEDQPGGDASTAFLRSLLPVGAAVEIIHYDMDRYGRTVALVVHDGHTVNGEMVRAGLAWVYPRYCKAKFCKRWTRRQKEARASGLGLWAESDPLPPWEWRRKAK